MTCFSFDGGFGKSLFAFNIISCDLCLQLLPPFEMSRLHLIQAPLEILVMIGIVWSRTCASQTRLEPFSPWYCHEVLCPSGGPYACPLLVFKMPRTNCVCSARVCIGRVCLGRVRPCPPPLTRPPSSTLLLSLVYPGSFCSSSFMIFRTTLLL